MSASLLHDIRIPPITAANMCRFRMDDGYGHHCLTGHIVRTISDERAERLTGSSPNMAAFKSPLWVAILAELQARNLPHTSDYDFESQSQNVASYNDDDRNSFEVLADVFNTAARRLNLLTESTPEYVF
jgi:hypothetical protein